MKKILIFLVAFISFEITANAQDATGSCLLPGGEQYAQVNFYKSASDLMAFFNVSSDKPMSTLKVVIEAEIYWNTWKKVILYNNTVYDIPKRQTIKIEFKMPQYTNIKNITVSAGNPVCKSE